MPHPVDIHVGTRLRKKRRAMGLSQQRLAAKIEVRFQQVQKYESGANRISASRLWEIAKVLEVPVGYFFDGLDQELDAAGTLANRLLSDAQTFDLVRAFTTLPEDQRRQISELAKVLASAQR